MCFIIRWGVYYIAGDRKLLVFKGGERKIEEKTVRRAEIRISAGDGKTVNKTSGGRRFD